MRRVLLVLEDYNETLFVETVLKKVGFSVETIPSEMSLSDKMVGFLPDLVIATGDGSRVNGNSVAKKVKRKGFLAKLLLVFTRQKLAQKEYISSFYAEGAIETPINPRALLRSVCDFTGVASEPILAKFDKLPLALEFEQSQIHVVAGGVVDETPSPAETVHEEKAPSTPKIIGGRSKQASRYAKFINEVPSDIHEVFNRKAVELERRRQGDIPDSKAEIEIDMQRKGFVEKLFKGWKR